MEPFARNGLSLPYNSSRFREPHSRINVPGLLLRSFANRFRCPFGLMLHYLRPGYPRLKAASSHMARCRFHY